MKFEIKRLCFKIKGQIDKLSRKQKRNILIFLSLGFILINSMFGGSLSTYLSQIPRKVVQLFIPYGKIKWLDVFLILKIRKFAHFVEYFALGILVSKYYYFKNKSLNRLLNTVYIILSIAFIDETIQIFSGRQSLVSDIWLDLSGGIVGILVYLIYKYHKFRKRQKEKK